MQQEQNKFWEEATKVMNEYRLNKVYVNCYIGLALSDNYHNFKANINRMGNPYLIGLYGETEVYIDSNMKWTDHRMLDVDDGCLIDFAINYGDCLLI